MTSASEENKNSTIAPDGRQSIRFVRRGQIHEISDFSPTHTVLDYLREGCCATGTKEGCAEGDCGACTVVIGSVDGDEVVYRAVNSCIQFVGSLDGRELITIEDISPGGVLHPVQDAMVRLHGSQCGFCTPGFVMALFALLHRSGGKTLTRLQITNAIAGNLCRCTGYRSIVDAAFLAQDCIARTIIENWGKESAKLLGSIDDTDSVFVGTSERFFAAPSNEEEFAALYLQHPDAIVVAGGTDVGLWVTKQQRDLQKIIYLGRVRGLNFCKHNADGIHIGAGCTYTDAFAVMAEIDPDIGELLRRLGSDQIRNAGTIGGNIANGSPIGDSPPVLIALGATVELRKGGETRTLPLEEFFVDYGVQDRAPSEYIRAVHIPTMGPTSRFRCYKIAKRFDQDISSVLGAFYFNVEGGIVRAARVAFGGMAATPKRAWSCEQALVGLHLKEPEKWEAAFDAMGTDYTPMSDHRASATYRNRIARALLKKALIEIGESAHQTRLTGIREVTHG